MKDLLGGIVGLAVGDALGVPLEFMNRDSLNESDLSKYIGKWSDDTSLTLATIDSLKNGLDYEDMMKRFVSWWKNGIYSADGEVFDIGIGTEEALKTYIGGSDAIHAGGSDEYNNGNGSLMRILPVIFYLRKKYGTNCLEKDISIEVIDHISGLTHNHLRSKIACLLYLTIANQLCEEKDSLKETIKESLNSFFSKYQNPEIDHFYRLFDYDAFLSLDRDSIKSSGYVVDTLEAALWCLGNTNSFEEAVSKAVLLGFDSDTVGSVTGGLAGIFYGRNSIPEKFTEKLMRLDYIEDLCNQLME